MRKNLFILFLILTLFGVGCAPIPPPDHAVRPHAGIPVPPAPRNAAEAEMAVEAGILASGVGLTILDIILSTQGRRGGVRHGPVHPGPRPHR